MLIFPSMKHLDLEVSILMPDGARRSCLEWWRTVKRRIALAPQALTFIQEAKVSYKTPNAPAGSIGYRSGVIQRGKERMRWVCGPS